MRFHSLKIIKLRELVSKKEMYVFRKSKDLLQSKHIDSIVVLGKGQVLEKGTHEGLLDLKAHYYKLWTSQTS